MAVFYNSSRFHRSYLILLPPEKRRIIWVFNSELKLNPGTKGLIKKTFPRVTISVTQSKLANTSVSILVASLFGDIMKPSTCFHKFYS